MICLEELVICVKPLWETWAGSVINWRMVVTIGSADHCGFLASQILYVAAHPCRWEACRHNFAPALGALLCQSDNEHEAWFFLRTALGLHLAVALSDNEEEARLLLRTTLDFLSAIALLSLDWPVEQLVDVVCCWWVLHVTCHDMAAASSGSWGNADGGRWNAQLP